MTLPGMRFYVKRGFEFEVPIGVSDEMVREKIDEVQNELQNENTEEIQKQDFVSMVQDKVKSEFLACEQCGSEQMYHDKRDEHFCVMCEGNNE